MSHTLLVIGLILIFIVVPFWLISRMDKHARTKGALFSGQPTRWMKLLAIALGIVFAGLFLTELFSSNVLHLIFPILAVALIAYGLGAGQLLSKLQGGDKKPYSLHDEIQHPQSAIDSLKQQDQSRSFSQNKFLRFVIRWAIILVISALALYGAIWTVGHPDNPLALLFVVAIIVVVVLAGIFGFFRPFR